MRHFTFHGQRLTGEGHRLHPERQSRDEGSRPGPIYDGTREQCTESLPVNDNIR
ncbi:hypothetical protein [Bradyrhizobium sp. CCBAU 11434]|uniref:hypothetical protein n=1 Tax=Bradyrhizobium sp. CCBAU 11434 TaxID=1630885 RepID=UPI0023050A77|nr:hypothetical protein [Bradyrhizobium sp. CCBAU 11434]